MTDADAPSREFEVRRVLASVREVLTKGWPVFLITAVLLIVLPEVVGGVLLTTTPMNELGSFRLSNLLSLTVELIAQVAMVHAAMAILAGRKASVGDSLGAAGRLYLPALGINLLSSTAIVLGLVFLIIPGVFLAVSWCVTLPERIRNGPGVVRSMRASWHLTSPARWKILGLYALLVAACAPFAAGYMISFPVETLISEAVVLPPIVALVSVLNAILAAAIFHELQPLGRIEEQTAQVFD